MNFLQWPNKKPKKHEEIEVQESKSKPQGSNPYLNAKAEWLERYGDYISQAHNWRVFALSCVALLGVSLLGNVIQAKQFKVVPYVVALDELGNTHSAGVAQNLTSEVPKRVIQAEISNYISNWRNVTADADLQKRMLTRLIAFSADPTKEILQDWFNSNNPYKRAETMLVSVDLKGLPQQVSQNAWRVEWTEKEKNRQGKTLQEIQYEATITVAILPPETEEEILANPLGVMIADIYYNKLLQQ